MKEVDNTDKSTTFVDNKFTSDVNNSSNSFRDIVESILVWEHLLNGILIIILLIIFLWSQPKSERLKNFGKSIQSMLKNLKELRSNQPGLFCAIVCSISVILWIIDHSVNGTLLLYLIFVSIVLGPTLMRKIPTKILFPKEWDNEMEEFLPAITDDNLQILKTAGELGDQFSMPIALWPDVQNDFIDEDLFEMKMPSHEEEIIDDIEMSDSSTAEYDDDIKFRTGHFERSSSSEEEAELVPTSSKLSDGSDSDFEIIDSGELNGLKEQR